MKTLISLLLVFLLNSQFVFADDVYTLEDVSEHNEETDCWVIYDNMVYDITDYLVDHDVYLNIRDWCGQDMTEDFETKAGLDLDHKPSSYSMLELYNIGELITIEEVPEEVDIDDEANAVADGTIEEDIVEVTDQVDDDVSVSLIAETNEQGQSRNNPYNLPIPLLLTAIIYWVLYYLVKNKKLGTFSIHQFNMIFNTILILTLIPSFGFGIFMMMRYRFIEWYNIKFEFMYWHVELSVVMGTIAISHLLQRWVLYWAQVKSLKKKDKNVTI